MNKKLKVLLVILLLVVIFTIWFYLNDYRNKQARKEIFEKDESIIYQCVENRQCISITTGGCCPNYTSINKKYKSYWKEAQKLKYGWISVCPAMACSQPEVGRPKCVNNQCKLVND